MNNSEQQPNELHQPDLHKASVSRLFVVFTYGDEEGMVQLSNTLDDLEKARSFCKAWKSKRTFIY